MQGINPFPATQRGTEEAEPKEETQRRKDARTQRKKREKRKEKKLEGRCPKRNRAGIRDADTGRLDSSSIQSPRMTRVELPTPSFLPYPTLPYPTLPYPTLPYPALPYPTPSSLCVFAPLRSILPFAYLRLCVFAFNSSLCILAALRLCVQFLPSSRMASKNEFCKRLA